MTALTGPVLTSKGDLLRLDNSGSGASSSLQIVKDGTGVSTGLKVSITGIQGGNITAIANAITTTSGAIALDSFTGAVNLGTASGSVIVLGNASGTTTINGTLSFGGTVTYTSIGVGSYSISSLTANSSGSFSGTNTGDQTITLTGDVTGSGTGSFTATIGANKVTTTAINANAVTYAKIQTVVAHALIGNTTGSTATPTAVLTSNFIQNTVLQTFTSSGTYTPTTGMVKALIRGVGPGGAGGGANSSGNNSQGGGGGGGGYFEKLLTAAQCTSAVIVIGSIGTGDTSTGTAGSATTFTCTGSGSIVLTANTGVNGGIYAASVGAISGGAGGTATNGDVNIQGEKGGQGFSFVTSYGQCGKGGNSQMGFGAPAQFCGQSTTIAGVAGQSYGGGGCGAGANGTATATGGNGAASIIEIIEFIAV